MTTGLDDKKRPQSSVSHLVKGISLDLQSRVGSLAQQPISDVSIRQGNSALRHRHVKAIYSYTPDNDDELLLFKNDLIEVLGEEEEGWWRGRIVKSQGRDLTKFNEGVFPSNFVDFTDETPPKPSSEKPKATETGAESGVQHSSVSNDMIQPKKVQGIGFGNIFAGENRIELRKSGGESKKIDVVSTTPKESAQMNKIITNGRKVIDSVLKPQVNQEYALVAFSYDAENDDELTLHVGDAVRILSKDCEDPGWWRGELHGREGVFPDNFVELMTSEEAESYVKSLPLSGQVPPSVPVKPSKLLTSGKTDITTSESSSGKSTMKDTQEKASPLPDQKFKPQTPKLPSPTGRSLTSVTETKEKSDISFAPKKACSSPLSGISASSFVNKISKSTGPPSSGLQHDEKNSSLKFIDERDAVFPLDSERLTHPTAKRPKNPGKRPPSQSFLKESSMPNHADHTNEIVDSSTFDMVQLSLIGHKISDSHSGIRGVYVSRDEYDKLKDEFEAFKRQCSEKFAHLERLLSLKG